MNRNAYIDEQKGKFQRKALAVLPIYYPKEILTALDILSVELWGPPGPPRGADVGRVQAYVCALVRNALAFIAAKGVDKADGLLFPHTCDSIQGLASVVADMGGWEKPIFNYVHPKGELRPSAKRFVTEELGALVAELEAFGGQSLEPSRLKEAIELHREIDAVKDTLRIRRKFLPQNDSQLYQTLRRGEYLWPEEHLQELQALQKDLGNDVAQNGVPLLLSGIVPEPMDIFEHLNAAGAFVAADDYAAIGRRIIGTRMDTNANMDSLVDDRFAAPPCSTLSSDPKSRLHFLDKLLELSGAKGVIMHTIAFCEPELFDIPAIKVHLEKRNIPLLMLETEMESECSGPTITRIEAFVEMVESYRSAA
jgi:benzoyl-CoA reductase/2-hydroxyglutaryl-CoA dehydratase subunit BcrC/BadD/HgdB